MPFQITRRELDGDDVISARPVLPIYELREHAAAMAGLEAARAGEHGYDPQHDCWWGVDRHGQRFQLLIEPLPDDIAA